MRQNAKVEGTKIAQAAKDLNVTSVTIRRYLTEFNIPTTSDENGIKVLPLQAMEELKEVRRLKEEGLTNPKVLEFLEEMRAKGPASGGAKAEKGKAKKAKPVEREVEEQDEEEEEVVVRPAAKKITTSKVVDKRKPARKEQRIEPEDEGEDEQIVEPAAEEQPAAHVDGDVDAEPIEGDGAEGLGDGRSKHSLTCQTCGKVFEHMNPRLRDCLDCYRTKRKERRRGGSDRHKNVIQHPLAQQVANKASAAQNGQLQTQAPRESRENKESDRDRSHDRDRDRGHDRGHQHDRGRDRNGGEREVAEVASVAAVSHSAPPPHTVTAHQPAAVQRTQVRNYRKAIEETRQITGSLKRRLERPDLPEGERRWLEQIYAYQLILHQGWRHLAEYKAATQAQGRGGEE